jgi:putative acyl-CoA dehydrogenase
MTNQIATHEVFNQSPDLEDFNLFDTDPVLKGAVARGGANKASAQLSDFGAEIGRAETLSWAEQANRHTPELILFDQKGRHVDRVEFHPSYHQMMRLSMAQGLHCSVWDHLGGEAERQGATVARGAGIYMMSQIEPGHVCPITMTNACVPAILKNPELAKQWIPKILGREYDPRLVAMGDKSAVTIGMGMTEKQGGTDVRANTTTAEPVNGGGGEYRVTGHKWFMSAPMCDAFLILAQAPGGLTCFLMPRVLDDGSLNGLQFQRLKSKLGNRSNASSEVEFRDASAWIVGEEGRGVNTIIEMVTLTRLDCILSSAGLMRWGLANAIHHTRHRTVFQKKLIDQPLMTGVLADMALDAEAAALMAFRLAEAFDAANDEAEARFARIMTPAIKYLTCKMVPGLANEAMECMGGNGYVEESPMARLYREAPLNAIWEGSGNVMCLDLLRAIGRDPEGFGAVCDHIGEQSGQDVNVTAALTRARAILTDPARMETEARFATEQLALAAAATLMLQHSSGEAADAYTASRLGGMWRATYGTFGGIEARPDCRAVVDRVMPEVG